MASPDFNIIGEALKMIGEEISKISDIAGLRPSHHDEPMNNQGVGDFNATTAAEMLSDRDNNTMAMELEELRTRSDAQKCAK